MSLEPKETEVQTAFHIGVASNPLVEIGENKVPGVILPPGYTVPTFPELMKTPIVATCPEFLRAEDFIIYINNNHKKETTVFLDPSRDLIEPSPDKPPQKGGYVFNVIFEPPGPGKEHFCQHGAKYKIYPSKELLKWVCNSNRRICQPDFIKWIQENSIDIKTPKPEKLSDICNNLSGQKVSTFKSGVRLDNGDIQFSIEQKTQGEGAKELNIPEYFVLNIPAFDLGEQVEFPVWLRYHISEAGELTFTFEMQQPWDYVRLELFNVVDQVNKATKLQTNFGIFTPRYGR